MDKNKEYHSLISYKLGLFYYSEWGYDRAVGEFEKSVEYLPRFKADESFKQVFSAKLYYTLGNFLILRLHHGEHSFSEKFRDLRRAKECFHKSFGACFADTKLREKISEIEDIIEEEWNRADDEGDIFKWYCEEGD